MEGGPARDDDSTPGVPTGALARQSTQDALVQSVRSPAPTPATPEGGSPTTRPSAPVAPRFADGTLVGGRFRVVRFIARGGMGEVFEVEDEELKERIALKTLDTHRASSDEALARFKREAGLTRRITHPNVCRMFDVGFHVDDATGIRTPFLTMQLLRGETLESRIRRDGRLTPEAAEVVAADLCAGLSAAHAAGIIHRDLKSTNVVFDRGDEGPERAVITDFGLARLHEDSSGVTHEGQILGTPSTMAPEQVNGDPVTPLTDLYSLGVVLFETLTGAFPFESSSPITTATMRLTRDAPSVRERVPELPRTWERAVARCLERDPARRFQAADEVIRALREPVPPERPPRARAAVVIACAAMGLAVVTWGMARRATLFQAPSPLASPSSILACPALRATPVDALPGDPGWLGAAAADLACRRARWVLGGTAERVRGPADLLHMPRQPGTDVVADPFAGDARARALAVASSEADAWLDGAVTHTAAGFDVTLDGRYTREKQNQRPFAHGEAVDARLDLAVERAFDALVGQGAIPRAATLDAEVARWTGATSIDQMLRVEALHWSNEQEDSPTAGSCAQVMADLAPVAVHDPFLVAGCAAPKGASPPSLTESAPLPDQVRAVLSRSVALPADWHGLVDRLDVARLNARARQERVALSLAEGDVLLRESETSRAHLVLLDAVQHAPQEMGVWQMLGSAALDEGQGTPAWMQFQHLLMTWMPAVPAYYATGGSVYEKDPAVRVTNAARAHLLAPANQNDAVQLGRALLDSGHIEEVRALAAGLLSGPPDGRLTGSVLLSLADNREGRFGHALDRLRPALAMAGPYTQTNWPTSYAVLTLLTLSDLLDQQESVADQWVTHVVVPDPPRIVTPVQLRGELSLLALCTRASPAVQVVCYDRVDQLRAAGDLPEWSEDSSRLLRGAREAHGGHFRAAVEAWRPLLGSPAYRQVLPYDVFVRADALDLAAAINEDHLKRKTFGGESATVCREADRLNRLGDVAHARDFARRAVAAWANADVDIPCLAKAHAILGDEGARGPR